MTFAEQEFQDKVCDLGIVATYAHGSQVTGGARSDSDLDIALLVPHNWSDSCFGEKAEEFCRSLAQSEDFPSERIHVQDLRNCPAYFAFRVLTTGVLLGTADPTNLAQFQARTFCEHWDEERYLAPILEAFTRRVQQTGYAS